MATTKSPKLGWIGEPPQPQVGCENKANISSGLGSMGLGMAKNLQKHLRSNNLPSLCFTNRTMSRGKSLEELGGEPSPTIADVVQKSDIIFSSVCVSSYEKTSKRN